MPNFHTIKSVHSDEPEWWALGVGNHRHRGGGVRASARRHRSKPFQMKDFLFAFFIVWIQMPTQFGGGGTRWLPARPQSRRAEHSSSFWEFNPVPGLVNKRNYERWPTAAGDLTRIPSSISAKASELLRSQLVPLRTILVHGWIISKLSNCTK